MIECAGCGTQNHFDGAVYCKKCGAELTVALTVGKALQAAETDTPIENETTGLTGKVFTESEIEVTDLSEREKEPRSPEETGFDRLLTQYAQPAATPENPTESEEVPEAESRSALQIESPADYLMNQSETSGTLATGGFEGETRQLPTSRDEEASEVGTSAEQPSSEISGGSVSLQQGGSTIPDDDRAKLLRNLSETLDEPRQPAEPTVNQMSESAASRPEATSSEPSLASGEPVDPAIEPDGETKKDKESGDFRIPRLARQAATEDSSSVFLRGNKLIFPAEIKPAPGEKIDFRNHSYTIRPAAFDKKSWILSGILITVLILAFVIQSATAPQRVRPALFGVVTNSETNEVLAGISVSIPELQLFTVTDENGLFRFPSLPAGLHRVKVEGGLYEARFFDITADKQHSQMMHGSLSPILTRPSTTQALPLSTPTATQNEPASDEPKLGSLKVNCNVADAMIIVNGKTLGPADRVFRRMKTGDHTLTVRRDGYQEFTQPIKILGDEQTVVNVNLLETEPQKPIESTAEDYFEQGETTFKAGKQTEAISYYTLALTKDNTMVKALLRRAEAYKAAARPQNARVDYTSAADLYLNSGMYRYAIACYDKVLEIAADDVNAYQARGWARILSGAYDDGLADIQKAAQLAPQDVDAEFQVGRALYATGRYKEAEKTLKKIRKQGDEKPAIFGYLALTYLSLGEEKDARKAYKEFEKRATSAEIARMSAESGWQRLTALAAE